MFEAKGYQAMTEAIVPRLFAFVEEREHNIQHHKNFKLETGNWMDLGISKFD
jgi:hypothetical protein